MIGCSQSETDPKPDIVVESPATDPVIASTSTTSDPETKTVEKDGSSVRSAESHVHGGATLSVVSENSAIQVELETPLYNLLGFEYEPKSDAEKALVEKVEASLTNPQDLIRFNPEANCSFVVPSEGIELFHHEANGEDAHHKHEADDQDKNEHDDHHDEDDHHDKHEGDDHGDEEHSDHDKHPEEEHAGHDDHEDSSVHKDLVVSYALSCQDIDKLESISVEFFETFPNFTELELVYLGPSQQMSADLTPTRTTAKLTR